jgi:hypothetical protein
MATKEREMTKRTITKRLMSTNNPTSGECQTDENISTYTYNRRMLPCVIQVSAQRPTSSQRSTDGGCNRLSIRAAFRKGMQTQYWHTRTTTSIGYNNSLCLFSYSPYCSMSRVSADFLQEIIHRSGLMHRICSQSCLTGRTEEKHVCIHETRRGRAHSATPMSRKYRNTRFCRTRHYRADCVESNTRLKELAVPYVRLPSLRPSWFTPVLFR